MCQGTLKQQGRVVAKPNTLHTSVDCSPILQDQVSDLDSGHGIDCISCPAAQQ